MSVEMHPAAPHFLPSFITAPGETDVLMVVSVVVLVIALLCLGSLYFWLHALPERLSHGSGKVQFQLVGVLSLLALFTHNNAFWVAALFLALIPIPDFWTPLANMAHSLARIAASEPRQPPPLPPASLPVPQAPPSPVVSENIKPEIPEPAPTGDASRDHLPRGV